MVVLLDPKGFGCIIVPRNINLKNIFFMIKKYVKCL